MKESDTFWMNQALDLAERGRGFVEPNPLVGAVVVRDSQLVGDGWHERYGQAHAEVNALARAGEAARGATLYVTLEPCCHHGKTPPCTEAILHAGVARVVAALEDPFPQVKGRGAERLRAAGVAVEFGLGAERAKRQNAPYLKLLAKGQPYIHLKWAMSLDGRIATRTGDSRWISNEASRGRVHELRGQMDAILIGIGTALADDPLLTVRPAGPRVPCRIVLDSHARLPLASQLVRSARATPTLVVTRSTTLAHPLRDAGCEVLILPADDAGRPQLAALLDELGRRRWTNLLVEGGGAILGSFFDTDLFDEVHVFVAPKVVGGDGSPSPVGGAGIEKIADAWQLSDVTLETLDGDVYLHGRRANARLSISP